MTNKLTAEDLLDGVKAMRDESFDKSPQITLGELLEALENIPTKQGSDNEPVQISFDFGTAYPTGFSSWRGSYDEIAINYALSGYDAEQFAHTDLKDFVEWLKKTIGATYTGWKGGDFTMDKNTPVWVANDGNVGNTGVIGVLNQGYEVIILTQYCEF